MSATSGTVPFRTWKTWYTIFGVTHIYLSPIGELSKIAGIPVLFYDQLGCGKSTHLRDHTDPLFWNFDLFLDEFNNLLNRLGIEEYDALGHSWGGMLLAEHALRNPRGLKRIILADSPASAALWRQAAVRLRSQLPPDVQETLRKHERDGTTSSPEYQKAIALYESQHLCRLQPLPAELLQSMEAMKQDTAVDEAFKRNRFYDWTCVDRVNKITIPTLVINGKYDEAADEVVQPFVERIAGVKWVQFSKSSHMPHLGERERYLDVIGAYLLT